MKIRYKRKLKSKSVLITILILAAIILIMLSLFGSSGNKDVNYVTVEIGYMKIKAEVADSFVKQAKGLMFRNELAEDEGMLFVFNKSGYHSIWMANMRFPIDIIWMNESKHVVTIKKDAQPCTISCENYRPSEPARYVLEVNSGFASKHAIKNGSVAEFSLK
jgi:uncharacterized membrane protein (UPF0127 family)